METATQQFDDSYSELFDLQSFATQSSPVNFTLPNRDDLEEYLWQYGKV